MTRAEEKAQYIEALSQSLAKLAADRQVLDNREERMMLTAREQGLTYAEIAVAKGCSVQAVEQWYSRRQSCNAVHPNFPKVTCGIKRGIGHEQHQATTQLGIVEWAVQPERSKAGENVPDWLPAPNHHG